MRPWRRWLVRLTWPRTLLLLGLATALGSMVAFATSFTITSSQKLTAFQQTGTVAGSASCTLTASADAFVKQDKPDEHHGTDATIDVQSGPSNRRSFVQFDVSSCPNFSGGTVQSATLDLFMSNAPAHTRTYAVAPASSAWTESGVTWNAQPGVGATTASASIGTTANVHATWTVTSDVQAFANGTTNNGWRVSDSAEGNATAELGQFKSREAGVAGQMPTLTISYAPGSAFGPDYSLSPSDDTFVQQDGAPATTPQGSQTHIDVKSDNSGKIRAGLIEFDTSSLSGCSVSSATLNLTTLVAPGSSRTYDIFRAISAWTEGAVVWATRPSMGTASTATTTINPSGITAAATSVTVTSGAALPAAPFFATIDSEVVKVTAKSTNTLTIVRNYFGSGAASHANGATVSLLAPDQTFATGTTDGATFNIDITALVQAWVTGSLTNNGIRIHDSDEATNVTGTFNSKEAAAASVRPELEITCS